MAFRVMLKQRDETPNDIAAAFLQGIMGGQERGREQQKERAQFDPNRQLVPLGDTGFAVDSATGERVDTRQKPGFADFFQAGQFANLPNLRVNQNPAGQQGGASQSQALPPGAREGDIFDDDQTGQSFQVRNGQLVRVS